VAMNSRRIFSWSKRRSSSESYRTGGLVSIDTSPSIASNGFEKVRPPGVKDALATRIDVVAQGEEGVVQKCACISLWSFTIR